MTIFALTPNPGTARLELDATDGTNLAGLHLYAMGEDITVLTVDDVGEQSVLAVLPANSLLDAVGYMAIEPHFEFTVRHQDSGSAVRFTRPNGERLVVSATSDVNGRHRSNIVLQPDQVPRLLVWLTTAFSRAMSVTDAAAVLATPTRR
ncbi:hypothetical protein [Cellulosimicrobium sp. Marseille-Q4280]|uniref:hypothetical protein n=1 Tax=Cellulosimicrobium sp. Marseille-Q4280 TaxID=2937992 RepID=UPI00203D16D4|nr:hypothetical protein [Cellulosimicrobium sp. Marseille-Q4280]